MGVVGKMREGWRKKLMRVGVAWGMRKGSGSGEEEGECRVVK